MVLKPRSERRGDGETGHHGGGGGGGTVWVEEDADVDAARHHVGAAVDVYSAADGAGRDVGSEGVERVAFLQSSGSVAPGNRS